MPRTKNGINIPLKQDVAINTFKRELSNLIKLQHLDVSSPSFLTVMEYCRSEPQYYEVMTEYLIKQLNTTTTLSLFQLLIFWFEKSHTMKQRLAPHIHDIFQKAYGNNLVREWAIGKINELNNKYGNRYPTIHDEARSLQLKSATDRLMQDQTKEEDRREKEYRMTKKRVSTWKQQTSDLQKEWNELLNKVIPNFWEVKEDTHVVGPGERTSSWGVEVSLCDTPKEVWKKYSASLSMADTNRMVEVRSKIRSLRDEISNGYTSIVQIQTKLEKFTDPQREEYLKEYTTITESLDTLDKIIYHGIKIGIM